MGKLWATFMGVVLWIAIYVLSISDLLTYVDDRIDVLLWWFVCVIVISEGPRLLSLNISGW